jgi:hypothetical protein
MLHFDSVHLPLGYTLLVPLGYDIDRFTSNSGHNFWTRPVDTSTSPIKIKIVPPNNQFNLTTGARATLVEYASGEQTITPNDPPGTTFGSLSNPDPFLHTDPYEEPIYETRLMCEGGRYEWVNDGCALNPISPIVRDRVSNAVGFMVMMHKGVDIHLSSCSGTLVGPDLFLTSRHCLTDPNGNDVHSASVTFEYSTLCDGRKRHFHKGKFFKVSHAVAAGAPAGSSQPPPYYDWILLRLDSSPGGLPGPLQLRNTELAIGETIFTAHHPNGAVKKFETGVHNGGEINDFSFAGGSSSSALFDSEGSLVRGPLSQGFRCNVAFSPLNPIRNQLLELSGISPPVQSIMQ